MTYSHDYTSDTDVRAQSLTHPRALPKRPHEVIVLISIHDTWEHGMEVCGCTDREKNYEEERLEVEECGLEYIISMLVRANVIMYVKG